MYHTCSMYVPEGTLHVLATVLHVKQYMTCTHMYVTSCNVCINVH